jgi:hypothetical protein
MYKMFCIQKTLEVLSTIESINDMLTKINNLRYENYMLFLLAEDEIQITDINRDTGSLIASYIKNNPSAGEVCGKTIYTVPDVINCLGLHITNESAAFADVNANTSADTEAAARMRVNQTT